MKITCVECGIERLEVDLWDKEGETPDEAIVRCVSQTHNRVSPLCSGRDVLVEIPIQTSSDNVKP